MSNDCEYLYFHYFTGDFKLILIKGELNVF